MMFKIKQWFFGIKKEKEQTFCKNCARKQEEYYCKIEGEAIEINDYSNTSIIDHDEWLDRHNTNNGNCKYFKKKKGGENNGRRKARKKTKRIS